MLNIVYGKKVAVFFLNWNIPMWGQQELSINATLSGDSDNNFI